MKPSHTMNTMTPLQHWTMPQADWAWYAKPSRLETLAANFVPVSLKEMDDVALLNRIDTKFLLTAHELVRLLPSLQPDYWMLEVDGRRLNHYRTLYFDTSNFELYTAHVNERPERYKVRCREYTDSGLSFLEVKHRTRKDRTIKERIPTAQPVLQMDLAMENWLGGVSPLDGSALEAKLWNSFTRITLVSKQCCERVTLDVDVEFSVDNRHARLDGIVIAEVKMDAARGTSSFLAQMRAMRIRPRGFSKYAAGVGMLYDQVKKNGLKPRMLWVEKMMKGSVLDE
jgi:hypothetical protein